MGQAAQLTNVVDSLRTTAGVYTNTSNDLDTTTLSLTGVVQGLLTKWEGSSSSAFSNACNRAWNDEGKISGSLNSTAAALTALASSIENNVPAISAYETDSAATTIKPTELAAAQTAANTAWAAIAAAVAEQAAAVEAAAAQVGVCSIGEGGPWGESGLTNDAAASKIKGAAKAYNDWMKGLPAWKQFLIQLAAITVSNSTSGIVSKIAPNSAGFLPPLIISTLLGGATAGGILALISKLGIEYTGAQVIWQSVLGGMFMGGSTSTIFHFAAPPASLPEGVSSDITGTLPDGEKQEVIRYTNGEVIVKGTQKNSDVTQEEIISPDGTVTHKEIIQAPQRTAPSLSPSPTPVIPPVQPGIYKYGK